ncbi:MAG: peptide chain release factor H [Bacteroidota bacterium]
MKQGAKQIFIHVTAGRGPAECCWVAAQVLKRLITNCEDLKLGYKVVERQAGPENGTISSALLQVSGPRVATKLAGWKGTVQWIGKSKFRKFHKRKNWFIGVSFFEIAKDLKMKHQDLDYDTFRGSGPGGQHRNKVETAVRVTHRPTGISATSTEYKSQVQNKKEALKKLALAFD